MDTGGWYRQSLEGPKQPQQMGLASQVASQHWEDSRIRWGWRGHLRGCVVIVEAAA